jgi:putative membrane-bound dehydrogenase-like protein
MKLPVALTLLFALNSLTEAAAPDLPAGALPTLPPKSPAEALATFDLDPDFRIELVAAEPLLADPVAISFDENGVLYVCEMRDYSERREEKLGRISRLEDGDGDGRMDRATVFAEGLPWPTGILCFDGGVFVMAAPELWFFKDTDGDGVADVRRVVLTGFSELNPRLNVQQMPNSLRWGPDQRVHLAEGGNGSRVRRPDQGADEGLVLRGRDLSFDPRTLELRAESGGGQYGMAFDDFGRKFVSSNSRHLMQIAYDANLLAESPVTLPAPSVDIAVDGPAAPVFRRSPDEAWRVIRTRWRVSGITPGIIEGGGTPSGYFTGATGVQIARGDRMWMDPANNFDHKQEAFIADTGSNLIHRKRLTPDGVLMRGERPVSDERREFLASTDNWFRPVQLENGPSGGLYVVDFYREIIEHPWSLPPAIKQHLDLNRGNDRGRIWRITRKASLPHRTVRLSDVSLADLVALLGHENGWHRDTAARLLWERSEPATEALLKSALTSPSVQVRLGALSLLAARGELDDPLLAAGLRDEHPLVNLRTLTLLTHRVPAVDWNAAPWRDHVSFTLALLLARAPLDEELAVQLWQRLAPKAGGDPWLARASLRLAAPHAARVLTDVLTGTGTPASEALRLEVIELAARMSSPEAVTRWLREADDDNLLALAAGVARQRELVRTLQLPAAVRTRIARDAQAQLGGATSVDSARRAAGALLLVEPDTAGRVLSAALGTAATGPVRDVIAAALIRLEQPPAFAELFAYWPSLAPSVREAGLTAALRQPASLAVLLDHAGEEEASTRTPVCGSGRSRFLERRTPPVSTNACATSLRRWSCGAMRRAGGRSIKCAARRVIAPRMWAWNSGRTC